MPTAEHDSFCRHFANAVHESTAGIFASAVSLRRGFEELRSTLPDASGHIRQSVRHDDTGSKRRDTDLENCLSNPT